MRKLENTPFAELKIGDTEGLTRTLTEQDLLLFAKVSGDINPVHLNKEFAATTQFQCRIAHGMWTTSLISCALATRLPGPGGIYLSQEVKFMRPVKIGDTVTVQLVVLEIHKRRKHAILSTNVINQDEKIVIKGKAAVIPAVEKIVVNEYQLPDVKLINRA